MKTTALTHFLRPIMFFSLISALALPVGANDGRSKATSIEWHEGLYMFMHEPPVYDHYSHYVVTYRSYKRLPSGYPIYGYYKGDVTVPYNLNYVIDEIGDCAFKDCVNLTSVKMEQSVFQIDSCSFENCTSLRSVRMPYTMKSIGPKAFSNCSALDTVLFTTQWSHLGSSQITRVDDGAFENCYNLPALSLPSLQYVGNRAFMNCKSFTSFEIPSIVTTIGEEAFSGCSALDTLYLQSCNNLRIGKRAFAGCESLKVIICTSLVPPVVDEDLGLTPEQKATVKVIVPKIALEAYRQAPYWKDLVGLQTRTYDLEVNNFYYNITADDRLSVTYRDDSYNSYKHTYTSEETDWFSNTPKHEYWGGISIPGQITYGGKTYYVTEIGENAFRDCEDLDMLSLGNSWNIKRIDANAFKGCSHLKWMVLPPDLQSIGANAFEGCSFLHLIRIPASVNLIDTCAFLGCSQLKFVSFQSPVKIGPQAFKGTNLRGHTLTGGIAIECSTTVPPVLADSSVFDASHYASSVVKVLYSLGGVFRADEVWNRFAIIRRLPYDFKDNNIWYRINNDDEVGVTPDNEVSYRTYSGDVVIPDSVNYQGHAYRVTTIEDMAFYFCEPVTVTLPNSVKRIGYMSFANSFVTRTTLGDSVETIGTYAFAKSLLGTINIPKSVKEIGDSAFFNTPRLRTITVDEDNPVYDSREGCNALIETATNRLIAGGSYCTEIPPSVTAIADYAFYLKEDLSHITIPGSVSRIEEGTFAGCLNMTQVKMSEPTQYIGILAFASSGLTSVTVPNSVDTIADGAFGLCHNLKTVTLGSGLKYLGEQAFGAGYGGTMVIDTVVCYAATPPEMGKANCFSGSYERATLLVPEASIELYKNDPNWAQFYKIQAIETSGIDTVRSDEAPKRRYNLQGQPVGKDYRGIVIENGKKILIK